MDDDAVANFTGITGTTPEVARRVLDMCGGDAEQAIMLWFNDEDLQRSMQNPSAAAPPTSSSAAEPQSSASRGRPAASSARIGREDTRGVIHLDSDDDDEADFQSHPAASRSRSANAMDIDSDDEENTADVAARVARTAQEDEDAAMAKRLQEELYQQPGMGDALGEDGVRAPIARTTETLVAPGGPYMGGDDDEDDAHAIMLEQLRRREIARRAGESRPILSTCRTDG
jgi:UBX domain-containing protein 7